MLWDIVGGRRPIRVEEPAGPVPSLPRDRLAVGDQMDEAEFPAEPDWTFQMEHADRK